MADEQMDRWMDRGTEEEQTDRLFSQDPSGSHLGSKKTFLLCFAFEKLYQNSKWVYLHFDSLPSLIQLEI